MTTQYLTIDISNWSPEEILDVLNRGRGQVETTAEGVDGHGHRIRARASALVYGDGWTEEALVAAVDRLEDGGHDDLLAVLVAAIDDPAGWVDRSTADQLTGRNSLRGFTKPLARVRTSLIESELLPEEAGALLEAKYGPGTGYARAIGFQAPIHSAETGGE